MPETTRFKRYSNRRLYNTRTSSYVTLDGVTDSIRKGDRVEVVDAKTNEDLTSYILTQVLLEEARKKNFLLPAPFLHLLIRYGDGALAGFFDKYLLEIVKNYLSFQTVVGEQFKRWMGVGFDFPEQAKKAADESNPLLTYLHFLLTPPPDRKGRNDK
jgi:polyhydroxyalkanoate synthesis repressor PhaR